MGQSRGNHGIKLLLVLLVFVMTNVVKAQTRPIPFSEASKALVANANEAAEFDSLRSIYKKKWTIGGSVGMRFITANNHAKAADTITFADFTGSHMVFGLNTGYFLTNDLQLTANINFSMLSKEQEVSSITIGGSNGISVEGQGSGGALLSVHLGAKYFISTWNHNRFYTHLEVGTTNVLAKGGSASFSFNGGSEEDIQSQTTSFASSQLSLGLMHRPNPGVLLDFKLGYAVTERRKPIGGLISVGGITTSVSLQFVLNRQKK